MVRGSTGDSGGNGPCFYLPDDPAVRSEYDGFVFTPKITEIWVYMYTGVRGHLAGNLSAACLRRAGILPRIG